MNVYGMLREHVGLSISKMARLTGVAYATWAAYENGTRVPRWDKSWRIIDILEGYELELTLEDLHPHPEGDDDGDPTHDERRPEVGASEGCREPRGDAGGGEAEGGGAGAGSGGAGPADSGVR